MNNKLWQSLANAWKIPDLRTKLLFTAAMVAIYRFGSYVPVPGINLDALQKFFDALGPTRCGLITTFGKPVVDRTIGRNDAFAFPSGHTGGATSLILVCALLLAAAIGLRARGTAVFAAASAAVVGGAAGTGMVAGGSHYPTDVGGGFCTAVASVLAVALVLDAVLLCRRAGVR